MVANPSQLSNMARSSVSDAMYSNNRVQIYIYKNNKPSLEVQ